MNRSFVFYESFQDCIDCLPVRTQNKIYRAISNYALRGIEPERAGVVGAIFTLVKPIIDASNDRYKASVNNGKKGGRPANNSEKTAKIHKIQNLNNLENPSHNLNDNVNVDVNNNININNNPLPPADEEEKISEVFGENPSDFSEEDEEDNKKTFNNQLETFWSSYPKKKGKREVEQWFASKISCGNLDFNALMEGLTNHLDSKEWSDDNGKFIPLPINWLRNQRWKDRLAPAYLVDNAVSAPLNDYNALVDKQMLEQW